MPSPRLTSRVLPVPEVTAELRTVMHALFARYYDGADRAQFERDLDAKDSALTLWEGSELRGFSTLQAFPFHHDGRDLTILFSGDTIVHHAYWGQQELAAAWLREVGRLSRRHEGRDLYWLLIVKGHRTYRFLSAFGLSFVPDWRQGAARKDLIELRNALARHRFGDDFDPATALVRFSGARNRLKPRFADATDRERTREDVAYFLAQNPGYIDGDELVCLCALSPENMRPFARRLYDQGRSL